MDNELVTLESALSPAEYAALADVPPELEWLANITNAKTRRFYQRDVAEFYLFSRLSEPMQLRTVARACHCLAQVPRSPQSDARQHPAQALGSLFVI
jgi:integrase/recombinase XerD